MNTSRKTRRRTAVIASLKALVTSTSLAVVLGGWLTLSALGQPAVTTTLQTASSGQSALPTPAAPTRPQNSRLQPFQPSAPTGGFFNSPPSFSSPAPSFQMPLARTHSSR
jgi:hypothetical protein